MLLMIDNYDSFTYNLVQYFGELGEDVTVFRNDEINLDDIERLNPVRIVISPGPCTPSKAGISIPVIEHYQCGIPILGVCLGHQSIGQAFGGRIFMRKRSCTERSHLFFTIARVCSAACQIHLTPLAIIRL